LFINQWFFYVCTLFNNISALIAISFWPEKVIDFITSTTTVSHIVYSIEKQGMFIVYDV
jgi:hypothetical protein